MDVKKIESLARLMQETGLTGLELVEDGQQLRLERQVEVVAAPVAAAAPAAPAAVGAEALGVTHEAPQPAKEGTLVLSPTVGVFYSAPSPDARPFVEVGDQVKKGDTLCIIEAMKLMNEITAEQMGTIREVCLEDATPVEFGTPLFYIEPSSVPGSAPETA